MTKLPESVNRALFDLIFPCHVQTYRCMGCGDRFKTERRIGCFGPIEEKITELPSEELPGGDREILCAHCGQSIWHSQEQQDLRNLHALDQQIEALQGELRALVAPLQAEAWCSIWYAAGSIESLKELDPVLYAWLWEGGPTPNPKIAKPKTRAKGQRLFLRCVADKGIRQNIYPEAAIQWKTERCKAIEEALAELKRSRNSIRLKLGAKATGPLWKLWTLEPSGYGYQPSLDDRPEQGTRTYWFEAEQEWSADDYHLG